MKRLIFLLPIFLGLNLNFAQNKVSSELKNVDIETLVDENINASTLSSFLNVLASDEYEGRETGQEGQRKLRHLLKENSKNGKSHL
ncbi:MAG: hypothetical protein R2769_16825 [Saprospiraceae bacterium]